MVFFKYNDLRLNTEPLKKTQPIKSTNKRKHQTKIKHTTTTITNCVIVLENKWKIGVNKPNEVTGRKIIMYAI